MRFLKLNSFDKMKRVVLFAVSCVLTLGLAAQTISLKDVFIVMPDSILPLLSKNDRMDLMDYHESGIVPRTANRLGGVSEMTYFGSDRLTVQTTSESVFEMVLLPCRNGSTLVCVINTVLAGYADSRIDFYNVYWDRIDADKVLKRPTLGDFLTRSALKQDSVNVLFDQSLLRLSTAEYHDGSLFFNYTSLDYIGDDADRFRSYFRDSALEYRWKGKRFRRVGR